MPQMLKADGGAGMAGSGWQHQEEPGDQAEGEEGGVQAAQQPQELGEARPGGLGGRVVAVVWHARLQRWNEASGAAWASRVEDAGLVAAALQEDITNMAAPSLGGRERD